MLLNPVKFHAPQTLDEARHLFSSLEDVKILAGGTFLLNSLKLLKRKGNKTPQNIISLRKVNELKGVQADETKLTIRAMTIINDLFDSPHLTDNFSFLKIVCRNISTNPIRNMATVGGNLTCRYTWTEMGAALLALDADMHFSGGPGDEEVIPVEQFFKNMAKTSKIFTHVSIPRDKSAAIAYRRVKKSLHVDIPLLAVCVKTNFKDGCFSNTRVAINNGVSFCQRDTRLEEFLNANTCGEDLPDKAMDHLTNAIYDTRSSDYKKTMFRVSLKSAIKELIDKEKNKG